MKYFLVFLLTLSLFGCGGEKSNPEHNPNTTQTDKTDKTDKTDNLIKPEKTVKLDGISLKSMLYTQQPVNDYASLDSLKVVFSTDSITDHSETISCQWLVGETEVSNNCEYDLKENEHLLPITVSAQLNYKEQVTKPFVKTFYKAFPLQQVDNKYSKVTLFNDGHVLEWNHILDGSFAYQAENHFQKIPSSDNNEFTSIYANSSAFSGVKTNGDFYLWGPKNIQSEVLINAINLESVKKVNSANTYFSILTNVGNVYVIGSTNHMNKKLGIDNVIDILTSESSTVLQTEEGKACLLEDTGKISCTDIQGDITHLVELKYDYKGNYALLTDQGYLYQWGKLAKTQGELVSQNVTNIIANDSAFAFLKSDGTVDTWGSRTKGGAFIYDYYSFEQVYFKASKKCVPELLDDYAPYGDDPDYEFDPDYEPAYDPICGKGYKQISIPAAYAPEKKHSEHKLETKLTNVKKIVGASGSFAALTFDGDVITWGTIFSGGNIYSEQVKQVDKLINIIDITTNTNGYTAIRKDGHIISWQGIWDINAEVTFGEYIKYYYYDENRPNHIKFSDANFLVSKEDISAFNANSGAYLLTRVFLREPSPHFLLDTWGFQQSGGGLRSKKLPGKVEKVFSRDAGFTIYTDQGNIYDINSDYDITQIKQINHVN